MAVRLRDIKIQISSPEIGLLYPENADFLRGDRAEPSFPGLGKGWKWIMQGVVIIGAMGFIVVAVWALSGLIWVSPIVSEVEGAIDVMTDKTLYYHYTVDGVRYDKQEPKEFNLVDYMGRSVPSQVLYFKFLPSRSKFKENVESPDFGDILGVIAILIFVGTFPSSFYYALRIRNRTERLRGKATHVIEGVSFGKIGGLRGTNFYGYQAVSPVTGNTIGGTVPLGMFDPALKRIGKGATVAILYLDDKNHTLL